MTKTGEFDKLLANAIDEALNSLGESVKQSIYFHIENNFKLTRDEIPENLVEFQEGLEKIFGSGSGFIEVLIMKNLQTKIEGSLAMTKRQQLEFIEYVDATKKSYVENDFNSTSASQPYKPSLFPPFTVSVAKP